MWGLGNFKGIAHQYFTVDLAPELFLLGGDPIPSAPNFTYDNELTILRLTSELDQVMVFCGFIGPTDAEFTLRIYRKYCVYFNFFSFKASEVCIIMGGNITCQYRTS